MGSRILEYIGQDGLLHILCCIVLVSVIDIVLPLWVAVLITAAVAVGKELVWDLWLGKGSPSWKDLLCDFVGIIIGCL